MADDRVDVYMPLYVRDFLASTIGWTAEEIGHYFKLLALQWDRGEAGLPGDMAGLERLSPGVSTCWGLIGGKFPVGEDGQRRNRRLEEHRADAMERRRRKSEAGKLGNRARWGGDHCDDHAVAGGSQCDRSAIANGSPASSPSPSREEEKNTSCSSSPTRPRRPSAGTAAAGIVWTREGGWQGITDAHREAWRVAYPAADLRVELGKANEWLVSHPAKARRSNWRRFLTDWLNRCQDRGGTHREAPGRAAAQIRTPRPDLGGQLLSDDEYAREKRRLAQQARFRAEREQAQREREELRRREAAAAAELAPDPVAEGFDHQAAVAAAARQLREVTR